MSQPLFGDPLGPWFRWFAWHPVGAADRGWVWLRYVWRRQCQKHAYLDGPMFWWFQHSVAKP